METKNLKERLQFIKSAGELQKHFLRERFEYDLKNKSFIKKKFTKETKKYGFNFTFKEVENFSEKNEINKLSKTAAGSFRKFLGIVVVILALVSVFHIADMFIDKNVSDIIDRPGNVVVSNDSGNKNTNEKSNSIAKKGYSKGDFEKDVNEHFNTRVRVNKSINKGTSGSVNEFTNTDAKVQKIVPMGQSTRSSLESKMEPSSLKGGSKGISIKDISRKAVGEQPITVDQKVSIKKKPDVKNLVGDRDDLVKKLRTEIRDQKEQISDLQMQLSEAKKSVAKNVKSNDTSTEKLQEEIEILQKKLADAKNAAQEKEITLQSEVKKQKEIVQQAKTEKTVSQIAQYEIEKQAKAIVKKVQQELEQAYERIQNLQKAIQEKGVMQRLAEEKARTSDDKVKELEKLIAKLQAKLAENESALKTRQDEAQSAQQQLQDENAVLRTERDETRKQAVSEKLRADKAEKEQAAANSEMTSLKGQVNDLMTDNKELQARLEQEIAQVKGQKSTIQWQEEMIKVQREELEEERKKQEDAQKRFDEQFAVQKKAAQVDAEKQAAISAIQAKELEEQIAKLKKELKALQSSVSAQASEYEKIVKVYIESADELEARLTQANRLADETTAQVISLKEQLAAQKQRNEMMKRESDAFKDLLQTEQDKVHKLNKQLEKVQQEVEEARAVAIAKQDEVERKIAAARDEAKNTAKQGVESAISSPTLSDDELQRAIEQNGFMNQSQDFVYAALNFRIEPGKSEKFVIANIRNYTDAGILKRILQFCYKLKRDLNECIIDALHWRLGQLMPSPLFCRQSSAARERGVIPAVTVGDHQNGAMQNRIEELAAQLRIVTEQKERLERDQASKDKEYAEKLAQLQNENKRLRNNQQPVEQVRVQVVKEQSKIIQPLEEECDRLKQERIRQQKKRAVIYSVQQQFQENAQKIALAALNVGDGTPAAAIEGLIRYAVSAEEATLYKSLETPLTIDQLKAIEDFCLKSSTALNSFIMRNIREKIRSEEEAKIKQLEEKMRALLNDFERAREEEYKRAIHGLNDTLRTSLSKKCDPCEGLKDLLQENNRLNYLLQALILNVPEVIKDIQDLSKETDSKRLNKNMVRISKALEEAERKQSL